MTNTNATATDPFATEMAAKAEQLTTRAERLRERLSDLDAPLEPLRAAMRRRAAELDFVSEVLAMRADARTASTPRSGLSIAS